MLGKTVVNEVALLNDPKGQLKLLIELAESIDKELERVGVNGTKTRITLELFGSMSPRILWPI